MLFERAQRLAQRLATYDWWQVLIEIAVIWVVVFVVVRFVKGTRAAGALKGTLLLVVMATLLVRILGQQDSFLQLKFLYDRFVTLLAITLIVVFQPELRRGLIRLGEAPILRRAHHGNAGEIAAMIAQAAGYLSKARFGGIMVIERETPLKGIVEGGTPIHGRLSARLLQTIFFPGSALHDLAVIIKDAEIVAAGVQLPLAEADEMPDPSLGSRHRAALGVSKECDALIVVVSEETGTISIAERGRLEPGFTPDQLRAEVEARLTRSASPAGPGAKRAAERSAT